jgi:hypothetical protein
MSLCLTGCALLYGDGWLFGDSPEPSETESEDAGEAAANGGESEETAANGGEETEEESDAKE